MNDAGLAHGVYYVPRDGSAVYHLDGPSGAVDRLGTDGAEAAVATALISFGLNRVHRAVHLANTTSPQAANTKTP
jgi:hypothetical protein